MEGFGDTYTFIHAAQSPSWFPYLGMERRSGSPHNYTDGLVPLWSAVPVQNIKNCYLIASANHRSILWNDEAKSYAIQMLSSALLPPGKDLNPQWGTPITSRKLDRTGDRHKTWIFRPNEMVPLVQNDVYQLSSAGVGRINPLALKEIRTAIAADKDISRTSAVIIWKTAPATDSRVRLYVSPTITVPIQVVRDAALTKDHRITITDLTPNTTYYYDVASEFLDPGDGWFILYSSRQTFKTKA